MDPNFDPYSGCADDPYVNEILAAVEQGDLDAVRLLVESQPRSSQSVNCHNRHGEAPLLTAIENAEEAVFDYLCDEGAWIDGNDKWWTRPMNLAFSQDESTRFRFLKSLCIRGARIYPEDLHAAIECSEDDAMRMVSLLVSYGAIDSNATNYGSIFATAENRGALGSRDCCQALTPAIEAGLQQARNAGRISEADHVAQLGWAAQLEAENQLRVHVREGDIERVTKLLQAGVSACVVFGRDDASAALKHLWAH